jgi:N-acetylglucosaminyl-diphospho-decaprenol L-rhamnosyltransferase
MKKSWKWIASLGRSEIADMPDSAGQKQDLDLSIVIVTKNNWKFLDPCLVSLYGAELVSKFDVVIVDNGSTDGTQAALHSRYPQIQLIQNDYNVGLSHATNQGIQATSGRYVLFFNDDTIVNSNGFDRFVEFLNTHPEAGAVGGKLIFPDGSFQSSYYKFPTLLSEFISATRLYFLTNPQHPSEPDVQHVTEADWITSACLMVRRAALDDVGLLDEIYFIYGDETDLQYRLKKKGWKVFYLPDVVTIHYGGKSLNRWKRRKLVYRGKIIFFDKNYGKFPAFILRFVFGMLSLFKLIPWGVYFILPFGRDVARKEISSNFEVLRLCVGYRREALKMIP